MCSGAGERGSCTSLELVAELHRILDQLRDEDLLALPAESCGEDVKQILRVVNRLEAESSRRLRRFDKGQGYASSLALTAAAWVRWQCHLSAGAACERVEVARQLDSLPQTSEAFAEGAISYRHMALIARTAAELGEKMDSNAEDILVTAARELDPLRLRYVTKHLRHYLQPDGFLEDANAAHERRFLHLSQTLDGIFRLDGQLDADGGAALTTALNALMGPPARDDERTATQRRADAMVELARRQLEGGGLPEVGGQKPHLMVTVEMATLSQEPGSRAAELEWAQPIPAETARRIACDCSITPVLMGAESHQVEAGRTKRAIPAPTKRALVVRDKGCRMPGCDRPVAWTDGHHLKHWADGGTHELYNLALLCARHHYRVHEGGWRLAWGTDGELVATPP